MKVLIIGLGSIAQKHIKALRTINPNVELFALRSGRGSVQVEGLKDIYSLEECPNCNFVLIANPTSLHAEAIKQVAGLNKPLFIEKPPFSALEEAKEAVQVVPNHLTYTAFNLRFLESLNYLKEELPIEKVREVNVYCGSYLPDWRPGADYRQVYSAKKELGGGVHLDLIHELDYVSWIFGQPKEIKKTIRKVSDLEMDAPDYANYLLSYDRFTVNITLNYFRRDAKRSCEIVMEDKTWMVNLFENQVIDHQKNILFASNKRPIDTYTDQMKYFLEHLGKGIQPMNSLSESIETLKMAIA